MLKKAVYSSASLPSLQSRAQGPGMAVFKQQKVEDLYEIREELGR